MEIKETENKFIVEGVAECNSCEGTGLYVGMAEKNGAAVICCTCNGTGKVTIKKEYKKFTSRKNRKGVLNS